MSLPQLLLLAALPLTTTLILLIAHLATLRGLDGAHRLTAYRLFTEALRHRGRRR